MTFTSYGSHDGKAYREKVSVRELAKEHLDTSGLKAVPCERALMQELQDAVDGKNSSRTPPRDEVVFLYDEVIRVLRLTEDGAVFHSPAGCEIDDILLDNHQVQIALEEDIANHLVTTDPHGLVGVSAFKASAACRREMERRLAHLTAKK